MLVYLVVCVITFIAGVWTTLNRKKKEDVTVQA
jgi:cbb3-type cytochrome oxidase subunit 3